MTIVLTIFRQLGLTGTVLILGYVFYEGVPVARDIPFIDHIPMVRELLAGRVNTEVAKAEDAAAAKLAAAREGFVLETELLAAQAQVTEITRQRDANTLALEEFRKRASAAAEVERLAQQNMEKAIAEDTDPNGSDWTDDDRLWLCSQRRAPDCGR